MLTILLLLCAPLLTAGAIESRFEMAPIFPEEMQPLLEYMWEDAAKMQRMLKHKNSENSMLVVIDAVDDRLVNFVISAFARANITDIITTRKFFEFVDNALVEFVRNHDISFAKVVLQYIRAKNSFGYLPIVIKELFPTLESVAQVREIRLFYKKHKRVNPLSRALYKQFAELLRWLYFNRKLPMMRMVSMHFASKTV